MRSRFADVYIPTPRGVVAARPWPQRVLRRVSLRRLDLPRGRRSAAGWIVLACALGSGLLLAAAGVAQAVAWAVRP